MLTITGLLSEFFACLWLCHSKIEDNSKDSNTLPKGSICNTFTKTIYVQFGFLSLQQALKTDACWTKPF